MTTVDRRNPSSPFASSRILEEEDGASAIEFALIFPVFFFIIYSAISYGLLLALNQSLVFAAEQGARAAIAADPNAPGYEARVAMLARNSVAESLGWLPPSTQAIVLGSGNDAVGVSVSSDPILGATIELVVEYPGYRVNPIIPVLSFPGLGSIPPLPDALRASAIARL